MLTPKFERVDRRTRLRSETHAVGSTRPKRTCLPPVERTVGIDAIRSRPRRDGHDRRRAGSQMRRKWERSTRDAEASRRHTVLEAKGTPGNEEAILPHDNVATICLPSARNSRYWEIAVGAIEIWSLRGKTYVQGRKASSRANVKKVYSYLTTLPYSDYIRC